MNRKNRTTTLIPPMYHQAAILFPIHSPSFLSELSQYKKPVRADHDDLFLMYVYSHALFVVAVVYALIY